MALQLTWIKTRSEIKKMPSTNISGYLAAVADSDLFGLLAIYCFAVATVGLFEKPRNTQVYRVMALCGLSIVPVLHAVGTYFLNRAPA